MQLITLHPSRLFAALKWAAFGLSLLVVAWLAARISCQDLSSWMAALAAGVAAAGALRVKAPHCGLRLRTDGWCELLAAGDGRAMVELAVAGAFVGAGWQVLRLVEPRAGKSRGHTHVLVLAPDAGTADELRRLRVWLNFAARRAELNSGGTRWSE